jgi:hypothetical protein
MVAWNTHPPAGGSFSVGVKISSWVFHLHILCSIKHVKKWKTKTLFWYLAKLTQLISATERRCCKSTKFKAIYGETPVGSTQLYQHRNQVAS